MRIDVHTHFQSLAYVQHLHERSTLPRAVLEGGNYVIQCGAGLNVPALPKMLDMGEKLRDMDVSEIDVAVLSHGIPIGPDALRGAEADEWARCINDDLANIVACHPDRFVGLGTVGFGDIERSIAEVDRCIDQASRACRCSRMSEGSPWTRPRCCQFSSTSVHSAYRFTAPGRPAQSRGTRCSEPSPAARLPIRHQLERRAADPQRNL